MLDFKAIRAARGWSQVKAAKYLGVSMMSWQNWERGCNHPTFSNLVKIREVFPEVRELFKKMSVEEFLENGRG